jgi:hypothetical protein
MSWLVSTSFHCGGREMPAGIDWGNKLTVEDLAYECNEC